MIKNRIINNKKIRSWELDYSHCFQFLNNNTIRNLGHYLSYKEIVFSFITITVVFKNASRMLVNCSLLRPSKTNLNSVSSIAAII